MSTESDEPVVEDASEDIPTPVVDTAPSDNALDQLSVNLTMPKAVTVEMVDVRILGEYERWFSWTSIFISLFVGFGTTWLSAVNPSPNEPTANLLLVVTLIFGVITAIFARTTLSKRREVTQDRQTIEFRAGRTS